MLYFVEDYYTEELIEVVCNDFERARRICDLHEGAQVTTETDEVLYTNIVLPF